MTENSDVPLYPDLSQINSTVYTSHFICTASLLVKTNWGKNVCCSLRKGVIRAYYTAVQLRLQGNSGVCEK